MSHSKHGLTRLLESAGPAGDCLREALAQQERARPLEVPPFVAVRERRLRRLTRQRSWSVLVLAAAALLGAQLLHHDAPALSIRAEPTTASELAAPQPSAQSPRETLAERPRESRTAAAVKPKPASSAPRVDRHAALAPRSIAVALEPSGNAKSCAQLAGAGAARQAVACYQKLSSGSGITAELSLFEQARIEGKVLHDPEHALETLESYRRRFPHGSLRGEVMLAQVDWLLAAGDATRALRVVDEALASGSLSERKAELERLRATLDASLHGSSRPK